LTSELLKSVPFAGDVGALLASMPGLPGVGQVLGPGGRNLIVGRSAHLRRWVASHLGAGKPPRPGVRPPTNLAPIATAVAWTETTSGFHQRLVYERLMGAYVAPSARRDLKPPVYLHLDAEERFPRIAVSTGSGDRSRLHGPFRDRRAAEKARDRLHKLLPLRPCDYVFEPDPALPLGLGCVYAQVRTCAAPCLSRVTEPEYRALASTGASWLARPDARSAEAAEALAAWVGPAAGSAGLVVEAGTKGLEIYPVRDGAVLEEGSAVAAAGAAYESVLESLRWPEPAAPRDDAAWLSAWLHMPRRAGHYFPVERPLDVGSLARRLRDKLGPPEGG